MDYEARSQILTKLGGGTGDEGSSGFIKGGYLVLPR